MTFNTGRIGIHRDCNVGYTYFRFEHQASRNSMFDLEDRVDGYVIPVFSSMERHVPYVDG